MVSIPYWSDFNVRDESAYNPREHLVSIPYWSDFNNTGKCDVGGNPHRFQSHIGLISTCRAAGTPDPAAGFNPILVRFQPDVIRRTYRNGRPLYVSIPYWSDFNRTVSDTEGARSRAPVSIPYWSDFNPVRAHPWIPTRGPSTSPLESSIYKGS